MGTQEPSPPGHSPSAKDNGSDRSEMDRPGEGRGGSCWERPRGGVPPGTWGGGAGALLMGWAWGPQLLPGEGPSWPGAGGPSTERHSKEGAVGRVGNVIKQSQRVLIKSVPSRGSASKGLGEERGTDNRLGPSTRLAWGLARRPASSVARSLQLLSVTGPAGLLSGSVVAPGPGVIPHCPFQGTGHRGDTPLQKRASGPSPQSLNSMATENTAHRHGPEAGEAM